MDTLPFVTVHPGDIELVSIARTAETRLDSERRVARLRHDVLELRAAPEQLFSSYATRTQHLGGDGSPQHILEMATGVPAST